MKQLRHLFEALEAGIRKQRDFNEVREADVSAMEEFGKALGVSSRESLQKATQPGSSTKSKRRMSTGSSVGSLLSNKLSPLHEEEDGEKGDTWRASPKKRRRDGNALQSEATIREASDEEVSHNFSMNDN